MKKFSEFEIQLLKGLTCELDLDLQNQSFKDRLLKVYMDNQTSQSIDIFLSSIGQRPSPDHPPEKYTPNYQIDVPYEERLESLLISLGLLKFYVQQNYTGPVISVENSHQQWIEGLTKVMIENGDLDINGDGIRDNLTFCALLVLISQRLERIEATVLPSVIWWRIRVYFLHQKCLEEKSSQIWNRIENVLKGGDDLIETLKLHPDSGLETLFYVEMSDIFLFHYDVLSAAKWHELAVASCGIKSFPVGVLGKRTKFQQSALPQLVLKVESGKSGADPDAIHIAEFFDANSPKVVSLDDDVRLDKVAVEAPSKPLVEKHSTMQQIALLSQLNFVKKSQPKDGLHANEINAYVNAILEYPKLWGVLMVTLLHRSIAESSHSRTVERSMNQLEALAKAISDAKPGLGSRYQFFFGLGLPCISDIDAVYADLLITLGVTNEALTIFRRLKNWEKVIECYNNLNLRHKAEEVIREELQKGPSVKLLIYLGDATDNTQFYEEAWNLSGQRSPRAQKQWGYYYFQRKQYANAIPHLEKSVELSPLEIPVWDRLGFAAMEVGNWNLCVKAYKHSIVLDDDNFQVWNNLGNAYIKLGESKKALKMLQEAVRCDYDVWKVWDNLMVVATDVGDFREVVHAYNRLIDLKPKYVDEKVLTILTATICSLNRTNPEFSSIHKNTLTLFGRLTSQVTSNGALWQMYADVLLAGDSVTHDSDQPIRMQTREELWHRILQYYSKGVSCRTIDDKWSVTRDSVASTMCCAAILCQKTREFNDLFPRSAFRSGVNTTTEYVTKKVLKTMEIKYPIETCPEDFIAYIERLNYELKSVGIATVTENSTI